MTNISSGINKNTVGWVQPTRTNRSYPQTSTNDTCRFIISKSGEIAKQSIHTQGKKYDLFSKREIRRVHKLEVDKVMRHVYGQVVVLRTKSGKTVVQQQAIRGCTAAVAAMLVFDNKKDFPVQILSRRNLGNNENMMDDIKSCGLKPILSKTGKKVETLKNLITQNGPAIVGIDGELSGHVIVVDKIDLERERVDLRDPWHGWSITVTLDAFKKRFSKNLIIQVSK